MRRRMRSAAFPVHRHSVPVLLVDGVLVALAYLLAFRLRFDNTVHGRYEDLFEATIPWVVPVSLLSLALLVGARFFVHLVVEGRARSFRSAHGARDVLIVGGGDGGRLVARELIRNPELKLRPVGFIDDDPRKRGIKDEYGLKVLGT